MTSQEQSLHYLQSLGYRLTPQRLLVLAIVAGGPGHLGVDEIHRQARAAYPYLDLATVYRTLRLFKQVGVVTEVDIDNRLHYELTAPGEKHHHMVCRDCHRAINLSPHYLEEFRDTLIREFDFAPDLEHFTVSGLCRCCRETAGAAAANAANIAAAADLDDINNAEIH